MCIRDRFFALSTLVLVVSLWIALRRVGAVLLATTTVYLAPVSYTHLRAHETVLDLVCRLLLDTKHAHCYTARMQDYARAKRQNHSLKQC